MPPRYLTSCCGGVQAKTYALAAALFGYGELIAQQMLPSAAESAHMYPLGAAIVTAAYIYYHEELHVRQKPCLWPRPRHESPPPCTRVASCSQALMLMAQACIAVTCTDLVFLLKPDRQHVRTARTHHADSSP